jgi:hypothetical protein
VADGLLKKPRRHSGARHRREPGIQKSRNSDVSGFRARRFASSRNDRGEFFSSPLRLSPKSKAAGFSSSRFRILKKVRNYFFAAFFAFFFFFMAAMVVIL